MFLSVIRLYNMHVDQDMNCLSKPKRRAVMLRNEEKKTVLLIAASLVITLTAYYIYARIVKVDIGLLLRRVDPISMLLSLAFLIASEAVKAVRLYLIVRFLGSRVTLVSSLVARLVGNTAGLLTPGNIGAEPVRVLTLASLNGIPIERLAAAGVLESLYDIMITLAVVLIASYFFLPDSLLVIVVSIFILALWIAGLTGFVYREGLWKRVVKKISRRLPERYRESFFLRYAEFTRAVSRGFSPKANITSLALTLLSLVLVTLSFFPLAGRVQGDIMWEPGILREGASILVGYSMSFVLSFLPTPGGSGFFEYGLGIALEKQLALSWRLVFITFSILPTILILVFGVRIRRMIVDNLRRSIVGGDVNPS